MIKSYAGFVIEDNMFDESKFYLGRLCKRGHEYEGTGKSLRYLWRGCVECRFDKRHSIEGKDQQKTYRESPKGKMNKKNYYLDNRDEILRISGLYQKENKEQTNIKNKKWRDDNLEQVKEISKVSSKKWKSKPENKKKMNEHDKQRRLTDPNYKLKKLLRSRMNHALRGISRSKHTFEILGCTYDEWKMHLISTFTDGMTWEKVMNGEIHIDHKIPICAFDLRDEDQLDICFNWRNTQCLWVKDNFRKISDDLKLNWKQRKR